MISIPKTVRLKHTKVEGQKNHQWEKDRRNNEQHGIAGEKNYFFDNWGSVGQLAWLAAMEPAGTGGRISQGHCHGCGAIQGDTVTNSREALEQTIANGFQYIEVDMAFTTDGQIAMLHDWESSASYYLGLGQNKAVSFAQYQQCRVMSKYTPLDMDTLAEILQQNPQITIITDTKEDNLAILTYIQKNYPQLVAQIIPQIYQYEEYAAVKAI